MRFYEEIIILSFSIDVDATALYTTNVHTRPRIYTYVMCEFIYILLRVLTVVNRRTISADVPRIKNVRALYTPKGNTLSSLDPRTIVYFSTLFCLTTDSGDAAHANCCYCCSVVGTYLRVYAYTCTTVYCVLTNIR